MQEAAKPFFEWVVKQCQIGRPLQKTLTQNLFEMSSQEVGEFVRRCYNAPEKDRPLLFDGKGQKYAHRKACFYFFGWMLRDAPVQRLRPIIDRASKGSTAPERADVEIEAIAKLFIAYRKTLETFEWSAIREVVYDRLEGSRRASRGRQKETVIRTGIVAAVQRYFEIHGNYGRFESIDIPKGGIRIGKEEFDVVVNLMDKKNRIQGAGADSGQNTRNRRRRAFTSFHSRYRISSRRSTQEFEGVLDCIVHCRAKLVNARNSKMSRKCAISRLSSK